MSPIPGSEERLAIQIHSQHVASSKVAEREGGKHAYKAVPRRIMAFLLDCAILAVLGLGLARTLGPKLSFLNEHYWWVGAALAAVYFGFFDSEISFGTTLGKRIMDVEVQRLDGEPPKIIDSSLRFVPFILAFAAFKVSWLAGSHDPIILAFELIGFLAALSVIAITPLHPARRGGHDLATGTVVLRRKGQRTIPPSPAKAAFTVFAIIAALASAGQGVRAWHMLTDQTQRNQAELLKMIRTSMPRIQHSSIRSYGIDLGAPGYKQALAFDVFMDRGTEERQMEQQARRIASKAVGSKLVPADISLIVVNIRSGFDIGIWQEISKRTFKFPLYGKRTKRIREPGEPNVRYKVMRKK